MFRILNFFWNRKHIFFIDNNRMKIILLFLLLFWYATAGFLYFELPQKPDLNWQDGCWWAFVTMTTVGYGDYFPSTPGGRYLVGIPAMLFGIGFLGFIISEVAAQLIEHRSMRLKGMTEFKDKEHIIIANFYRLKNVLKVVEELKSDVSTAAMKICLVDETLEELPHELVKHGVNYVRGNPADTETLIRANAAEARYAIVLSKNPGDHHSDDQNLATTLVIESINPEVFSVVEVIDPGKIEQMELAGCDSAVCVSKFSSNLIIQELQDPGVKRIVEELTSNRFGLQIYLTEISTMKTWEFRELVGWGHDRNYTVLGMMREDKPMLNCALSEKVLKSDKAVIIGNKRPHPIKA